MKHLFFLVCIILFQTSCIKEKQTSYTAELNNNTNHNLLIEYYEGGIINSSKTIVLKPSSTFNIAKGLDRGIVNNAGFSSNYYGDSAIITFDNMYKMTHYFGSINNPINKSYEYSSQRNIFNYLSYEYSYKDESKNNRIAKYKYTFIEQDYLDVKP